VVDDGWGFWQGLPGQLTPQHPSHRSFIFVKTGSFLIAAPAGSNGGGAPGCAISFMTLNVAGSRMAFLFVT
jgi:hypothetical protein